MWRLICAFLAVAVSAVPIFAQPPGFEARFVEQELRAYAACTDEVEELADYDFRWLDGLFGFKFTDTRAGRPRGSGKWVAVLRGDQIEFQNASGRYVRHHYRCHYDLDSRTAVFATSAPGRLPARYRTR